MFLLAEISIIPGQASTLNRCITEFLEPVAIAAGWKLIASLRENDDENKVVNIWDVGDRFAEGLAMMRDDDRYSSYSPLLKSSIAKETHTFCHSWR